VVTKIPADNISPNSHNPRRFFDPEPLEILKESIAKLGVLVPFTGYPKRKDATNPELDKFVLLDGERRWRCVLALRRHTITALVETWNQIASDSRLEKYKVNRSDSWFWGYKSGLSGNMYYSNSPGSVEI